MAIFNTDIESTNDVRLRDVSTRRFEASPGVYHTEVGAKILEEIHNTPFGWYDTMFNSKNMRLIRSEIRRIISEIPAVKSGRMDIIVDWGCIKVNFHLNRNTIADGDVYEFTKETMKERKTGYWAMVVKI